MIVRTLDCTPGFPVLSINVDILMLDRTLEEIYGLSVGTNSPLVDVVKKLFGATGISYNPTTYVLLSANIVSAEIVGVCDCSRTVLKMSGALFMGIVPEELI